MMQKLLLATVAILCAGTAHAQVRSSGYELPAALAVEAAVEAVQSCQASGFRVSVAVVDPSGETRAFIKGDHATVHTKNTSFRKAYTTVTLGPIFAFEALGAFVEKVKARSCGQT